MESCDCFHSNEDMKFSSPVTVVGGEYLNVSRTNNQVRQIEDASQVLTRNGLKLKNRESRIARRNRINQRRVGKRSSLRLNKPLTSVLKVTRASRQAADLCNGMNVDGNPSKKLLFMLSLGLVPKTDKFHGPVVQLGGFKSSSCEVSKNLKPITYQNAKENLEDGSLRSRCKMQGVNTHSLPERKLRSNQHMNKIADFKPQRTAISVCKQRTNTDSKISQTISNCAETVVDSTRPMPVWVGGLVSSPLLVPWSPALSHPIKQIKEGVTSMYKGLPLSRKLESVVLVPTISCPRN
ncbi:unnamed protein product [Allacma fusca]|uniref:Uncharacterized protein n=1 Tax=Allacma fusca TaxID=39272 RepID=A0A8J2LPM3_9HEXA|nr:unnamed protein product [Allacma fusca]